MKHSVNKHHAAMQRMTDQCRLLNTHSVPHTLSVNSCGLVCLCVTSCTSNQHTSLQMQLHVLYRIALIRANTTVLEM